MRTLGEALRGTGQYILPLQSDDNFLDLGTHFAFMLWRMRESDGGLKILVWLDEEAERSNGLRGPAKQPGMPNS